MTWLRGPLPGRWCIGRVGLPDWHRQYLALLAQQYFPTWGLAARPAVTDRLFRILATSHAGIWHAAPIGASLGLSYHTVSSYLEYVEGAFLPRQAPPFLPSLRKRLIRRPEALLAR